MVNKPGIVAAAPHYISGACANCDNVAVTVGAPLFCSLQCRQVAELVRYVRRCRRDGRDKRADVREAIQMRMAMVLAGGYPERERRVSPEIRAEVFRRAQGRMSGSSWNFGRPSDPSSGRGLR